MKIEKELSLGLLKNTHDSLKWMWQVLMGGSLVLAVKTCYPQIREIINCLVFQENEMSEASVQSTILLFVVFLPLFFRVFYGDNRLIDLNYMEAIILKKRNMEEKVNFQQFSGISRFLDIVSLMIHAILFLLLSVSIDEPQVFIYVATIFLIINSLWLSFIIIRSGTKIKFPDLSNYTKRMYSGMLKKDNRKPRNDAMIFWVLNNMFHAIVLITIIVALLRYSGCNNFGVYAAVVTLLSNSVFDIYFTWEFYFPDIEKFIDLYKEKESG